MSTVYSIDLYLKGGPTSMDNFCGTTRTISFIVQKTWNSKIPVALMND